MRKFTMSSLLIISVIFFVPNIICAQKDNAQGDKQGISGGKISSEQLALLKANRAKQIEFRNAFRETLSGNQLDILTDPRLTREAKIKSFRASLSDNQVSMIKSNARQVRAQKFEIRSTLSNRQRMQIKRMGINRALHNRVQFQRARRRSQKI